MDIIEQYLPPVICTIVIEYTKTGILLFKKNEFYFYDGIQWDRLPIYISSSHTSTPLFKQANYFNAIAELLKNTHKSWYDKKAICEFPIPIKKKNIVGSEPGVIGSTVFFTGGYQNGERINSVCSFSSGTWKFNIAPLNIKRAAHITVTLNNRLYVIGNSIADSRSMEYYDIEKNIWIIVASIKYSRSCKYSRVTVCNGKIYVFGGFGEDVKHLYPLEEYDPILDIWKEIEPSRFIRDGFNIFSYENCVYVVGGKEMQNGAFKNCDKVECYDPITNKWTVKLFKWRSQGFCNAVEL